MPLLRFHDEGTFRLSRSFLPSFPADFGQQVVPQLNFGAGAETVENSEEIGVFGGSDGDESVIRSVLGGKTSCGVAMGEHNDVPGAGGAGVDIFNKVVIVENLNIIRIRCLRGRFPGRDFQRLFT